MNILASKIVAKSFFKELKHQGFDFSQIIKVSSEIIKLVTKDIKIEKNMQTLNQDTKIKN